MTHGESGFCARDTSLGFAVNCIYKKKNNAVSLKTQLLKHSCGFKALVVDKVNLNLHVLHSHWIQTNMEHGQSIYV